jgi:hypothetical protein
VIKKELFSFYSLFCISYLIFPGRLTGLVMLKAIKINVKILIGIKTTKDRFDNIILLMPA